MTAVDGPDPADVMYETVRAAVATIIEATPPDARAEMLARVFRDLGTELGDAGHLSTEDATVEWGVTSPFDADPVVCSKRYVATTARENGWPTFTRAPGTKPGPWVPADPTARRRMADDGSETP